jgi:hypothetical protein
MSVVTAQASDLLASVNSHVGSCADSFVTSIDGQTKLLRQWVEYLIQCEATGTADVLLLGVATAVLEVAALLTVGFARCALAPMRSQIDLILSWLYFKDHPVEWARLERYGDGFMQKAELIKYLNEKFAADFGKKYGVLKQAKLRSIEEPFAFLSAHLHKQSSSTVVSIASCAGVVCEVKLCNEVVVLQGATSEYLNDILLSCFSADWAALPSTVVSSARARLSAAQEAVVFS